MSGLLAEKMRANGGIEVSFDNLEEALLAAGKNLRLATLSLRSCYSVNASSIKEFTDLRNGTADEAQAYKCQVLPVAKASCEFVKNSMDYFAELDKDEVMDIIDSVMEDATNNEKLMTINKDAHKHMASKFMAKQDMIDKVLSACQLEKKKFEEKAASLRASAETKSTWCLILAFVPVVGAIASPILDSQAASDIAAAIAKEEEAQLAVNASYVMRQCLAPAINEYTRAMERAVGAFTAIVLEIKGFQTNLSKLKETEQMTFFKMCKKKAAKVASACGKYLTFAELAEADLACLPDPKDLNYVQQWLANQRLTGEPTFKEQLTDLGKHLPKEIKKLTNVQ